MMAEIKSCAAETDAAMRQAMALARDYVVGLPRRPVDAKDGSVAHLREQLGGPLPDDGCGAADAVDELARFAEPGLVASGGPRYFGFVTGGVLPAALGAEWLTAAWDQNAGLYVGSPAAAIAEEVAGRWLADLFGLPTDCAFGFTTGGTMANFCGLAAARGAVLENAGWDVEDRGLRGAPEINVVVGDAVHASVLAALRMLGLGRRCVRRVALDDAARMSVQDLEMTLKELNGPVIVCAQAGEVNTGSFDPFQEIADLCHAHGGWLHVDGAFGMWAAASASHRHLTLGVERADSWATDGHKWLNVPYDCGYIFVRHGQHLVRPFANVAAYYPDPGAQRDGFFYVPEFSRRARGFSTWAALRSLGRRGVESLVDRCCGFAMRAASELRTIRGVEILNDVTLNQVLFRFVPETRDSGDFTAAVVAEVQKSGTCWFGMTTWRGMRAARLSFTNAMTTDADVDCTLAAIAEAVMSANRSASEV